jgi:hypothetical protein
MGLMIPAREFLVWTGSSADSGIVTQGYLPSLSDQVTGGWAKSREEELGHAPRQLFFLLASDLLIFCAGLQPLLERSLAFPGRPSG